MKKRIIIFFGPPGSGKGTQADMLGEYLGLPVISPGELFRHERDRRTVIGKQVETKLAQGELVPDELVEKVIASRLSWDDTAEGYILDGYPRRMEQLPFLEKRLSSYDVKPKVQAVYIDINDEEIKHRLSGRRVCDCGEAYHITFNPPLKAGVCDKCGAGLYQRKDDDPEIIKGRLKRFHERIGLILDHFGKDHFLVRIDGTKEIETIQKDIRGLLNY